jgi:hypothetical protein
MSSLCVCSDGIKVYDSGLVKYNCYTHANLLCLTECKQGIRKQHNAVIAKRKR